MSLAPRTEFVSRGDGHLAYQVFGDGPARILEVGYPTHQEQLWQFPLAVRGLERLARLARVAQYDMRGYGMSDPLPVRGSPIEELAADALAVLDAADFPQAVLWGAGQGGAVAIWLAVHRPHRVTALVIDNASACMRAHPGYDIGLTDTEVTELRAFFEATWGTGITLGLLAPELLSDERLQDEWARYERIIATPTGVIAGFEMSMALDVRDLLPAVAVPTLVAHSVTNTAIPSSHGRYLAEHIPGARYLETEGTFLFELDDKGPGGDIAEFLTGSRMSAQVDRSLLVVLFTDIANSTDLVAAMGDAAWRDVLDDFRRLVRSILDRYDAQEVNTRGDDFFAVAASPSIAVEIARVIRSDAASRGLSVRSGIHLGEVEHQGNDYTGVTVHIGARVAALAQPGEILISQTVRDALTGSTIKCTNRGTHRLKGLQGEWQLSAIEH